MNEDKLEKVKEENKVFKTSNGVKVKEQGKPNMQMLAKKLLAVHFEK